jgi:hypothetical protein
MGCMFELSPDAGNGYIGVYDDDALLEMGQYVRNLPAVYQSPNGWFVLAENEEIRDSVVASGRTDEPHDYWEHICIKREHVLLEVEVNGPRLKDVVRFLEWSMKRWPATLLGDPYGVVDIPRFLDIMDSSRWK